jgi:hypothetical protein
VLDLRAGGKRRRLGVFAGAIVLLGSLIAPAPAIMVADATLFSGNITVWGSHGAKSADITWQGVIVTQTNKGGAFSFTTAIAPQGCVGTLSDGVSTVDIAIIGCTVAQPAPTIELPATGQTSCWGNTRSVLDCVMQ